MFASSPEELEMLLEDAVLLGDEAAVGSLFDAGAVLITGPRIAGPEQALAELSKLGYVASTRTVSVRHDAAVVVGDHAVNVSFRAPDGAWLLVATIVRARPPNDGISMARHEDSSQSRGGNPHPAAVNRPEAPPRPWLCCRRGAYSKYWVATE